MKVPPPPTHLRPGSNGYIEWIRLMRDAIAEADSLPLIASDIQYVLEPPDGYVTAGAWFDLFTIESTWTEGKATSIYATVSVPIGINTRIWARIQRDGVTLIETDSVQHSFQGMASYVDENTDDEKHEYTFSYKYTTGFGALGITGGYMLVETV